VDSLGRPKAAYYYLRRAWSNQHLCLTDEGLDGLHLHVINETSQPLGGRVEVLALKDQHIAVACQSVSLELAPRGRRTLCADQILGAFYDLNYAYRFGPPKHDVVIATLFDHEHKVRSEAFYFVEQREPALLPDAKLEATVTMTGDDAYSLVLGSDRFLQSVNVNADGFLPDDNYFHLAPARTKIVRFRPFRTKNARFHGTVEALNLKRPVMFSAQNSAG
ncbi:MAG TPA: glycoside hydrolase family 2 protein, partial [Gemmataceae bacterium]|nr:glycoside hydrolase family 2 protein [Gemmataceae bacterium]